MAVAAFVVSVLALLVSGYVGWRQYTADHRIAEIEEARRIEERSPRIRASWLSTPDGPVVRIVHEGGEPLDALEWSFRPDLAIHPLVGLGRRGTTNGSTGALAVGGVVTLTATLDANGPSAGPVAMSCTGRRGREEWTVVMEFDASRPPADFAY